MLILGIGFFTGAVTTVLIYHTALNFAWREYQGCADRLAIVRQEAIDEQNRRLDEWAADKVVIDSDKFADAIIQTTKQFNMRYKAGDVPVEVK
jgi:hypothetical protein